LSERTNEVWADLGAAVARLRSDPWIAEASVQRRLPFGLRIRIVERTPVVVMDDGTRRLLVAADGTILGDAGRACPLPVMVVPTRVVPWAGRVDVAGAARVAGSLAPRVRSEVRRVIPGPDGTVALILRGGVRVDYGWVEDLPRKARVLSRLLSWAAQQGVSLRSVSLVAPAAPAGRLAG
jgi:cell division protein FtsQ